MICWTQLLNPNISPGRRPSFASSPEVVVWNITSLCNLSCRHCYFESTPTKNSDELSRKEAQDFILDLARLKVHHLLFSGGEPLLRKDVFGLARLAREKGIKPALSTNGTLITKAVAKKIKEAGFSYAGISLDGTEETNDAFRQSKGAFKASLSAIRHCQDAGLKVGLRFTLTRYNLRDLPAMFTLIEKEPILRFCIYHLVYTGRGENLKEKDLTHQEKKEALEFIWQKTTDFLKRGLNIEVLTVDNHADGVWIYLKLEKTDPARAKWAFESLKAQGGNSSGIRLACVDNLGNIFPDQFWRAHSLGNIRKQKLSTVWQDKTNSFLSALRNRRTFLKGRCARCKFLDICNGNFRARAETMFGDPWAEDPACYLTEEEIGGSEKERECICQPLSVKY